MKRVLFIAAVALLLGCPVDTGIPVKDVTTADDHDYRIVFLFEKNGVSMFRFYDRGEYRYFTIGNGSFQPQVQERVIHDYDAKGVDHPRTETWVDGAPTQKDR